MTKLLLHSDGGSRHNPGPAAIAFVLHDEKGKLLDQGGKFLGTQTNNEAEYLALLWGMQEAASHLPAELICCLDSELVVNQLNGFYRIKKPHLAKLIVQIKELEKQFAKVAYIYVPREENDLADALVNKVLDENGCPKS